MFPSSPVTMPPPKVKVSDWPSVLSVIFFFLYNFYRKYIFCPQILSHFMLQINFIFVGFLFRFFIYNINQMTLPLKGLFSNQISLYSDGI